MKKEVNKKYTDILPSFWKENNLPYSFIGKDTIYTDEKNIIMKKDIIFWLNNYIKAFDPF